MSETDDNAQYGNRIKQEDVEEVSEDEKPTLNNMASWALDNDINFRGFDPETGIVTDVDGNKHYSPYSMDVSYYDYSEDADWSFAFDVDAKKFCAFIRSVSAVVDECRLHISPNGLEASAVDPANVAMVEATLEDDSRVAAEATVGVNLNQLEQELPYYFPGDNFQVGIDAENDVFSVWGTEGECERKLVDPDSLREEPERPDVDYTHDFELPMYRFKGVFGSVAEAADGAVKFDTTDGSLHVAGESPKLSGEWEYSWEIDADVEEDSPAYFSNDYLDDIMSGIPDAKDVTIKFGPNHPLFIETDGVTYLQAPRITPGGDYDE